MMIVNVSRMIVVGAIAALLCGCARVSERGVRMIGGYLNPRFTLDREPLSMAQQSEDPTTGPYRRAPGSIASYVYPMVDGADHLIQADCYWAAHESGVGDDVLLNWESVAIMDPRISDSFGFAPGDEAVSLCRLNHPVTRQPFTLQEGDYEELDDDFVVVGAPQIGVLPISLDKQASLSQDMSLEGGLEAFGTQLVEIPSRSENPDRACDGVDRTLPERVVETGVLGYNGGSERGLVATCSGPGRRIRPERDARYEIRHPGSSGIEAAQSFGVIMTAGTGDSLLRAMDVLGDGSRQWSTFTDNGRWGENFSPRILVEEVRVVERTQDSDRYLSAGDLAQSPLCVRKVRSASSCLRRCPVEQGPEGEGVFRPAAGGCLDGDGDAVVSRLTPTVDIDELGKATAAIDRPLGWQIEVASANTLLLEFRLATQFAGVEVAIDPIVLFGEIPPQGWRQKHIYLRNTGARSVVVDDLYFTADSSHPQSFSFLALSHPVSVPLGVDFLGSRGQDAELRLAEDFFALPAVDMAVDEDRGIVLLGGARLDGQTIEAYGETLTFDGGLALTHRPDADFQRPEQTNVRNPLQLVARHPVSLPATLNPGEEFFLLVTAQPAVAGTHRARLAVDYFDPTSPTSLHTVVSSLDAIGREGPVPSGLPSNVVLVNDHETQPRRYMLIGNAGDQPYTVNAIDFDGQDPDRFWVSESPAGQQIMPGEMRRVRIHYDSECVASGSPVQHDATLVVETSAVAMTTPVVGWSVTCN